MPQAFNPLSRRPNKKRLVVAVRGPAGSGKSSFAASLAEAGVGRLLFIDVERKSRFLEGVSDDPPQFDAVEIHLLDEVEQTVDWLLHGEGRAVGYGAVVLDSWASYFSRKHSETLRAIRQRTGDPAAEPTPEQLQSDQILYQSILRSLCIDSGLNVVITDQTPNKVREQEENELGQVTISTRGGLEFFADVVLEMSVQAGDFEIGWLGTVVKSNTRALPIGTTFANPSFKDLLERVSEIKAPKEAIHDVIGTPDAPEAVGLEELISQAQEYGIAEHQLSLAARKYHRVADLRQLTPEQRQDLLERMRSKHAPPQAPEPAVKQGKGRAAN